jgi:hypothetical protein
MAEQTFRSPGFFEQEIDLSARVQAPVGVPAGIIGTSKRGPAFVPVTVGSFADFRTKFGDLDHKKFGPYAVNEFLKHRNAVTYLRVLGAGSNDTTTDIETTRTQGTVLNAGFKLTSQVAADDPTTGRHNGAVQFLVAKHFVSASEAIGYPVLTQNDSFGTSTDDIVNIVRAMIFVPSGTRIMVLDGDDGTFSNTAVDYAAPTSAGKFKLVISSSSPGFSTADGNQGLRILTASLDPEDSSYIGKILNTDPEQFPTEEHLLYADFAVEDELATISTDASDQGIAILSGSALTSEGSGDTSQVFREAFGRFDTRYTTPSTTNFISQPFGKTEFDLFHFEAIDDGVYSNDKYKISITDLRKSTNPLDPYGTFSIAVRKFDDLDTDQQIIERFPNVSLNPKSENYIARQVGDLKVYYNFDADSEDERRLIVEGKYPNRSNLIRVVVDQAVEKGGVPSEALPFGFRGIEILKTSDTLTDSSDSGLGSIGAATARRMTGLFTGAPDASGSLSGSIVPPLPYRFKLTKGAVNSAGGFVGNPGIGEIVDGRLHWGVRFERLPKTGSVSNAILNSNVGASPNPLVSTYTKFLGIKKLDTLVTGSGADLFNNNKFTLARVAFSNAQVTDLTGSVKEHIKETAYIRNGTPDPTTFKINDGVLDRITLASLVALTSSIEFNRFTEFTKYSTIMGGGFDGVNILDKDAARLNDRAASSDTGGAASTSYTSPGLLTNVNGTGKNNSTVKSYNAAVRLMTDPFVVNTNLLAIPGIRDSFVTDFAAQSVRDYALAMYVMDPVEYDESTNRLFDEDVTKPDVRKTKEQFESRAIDNNYVATYFPDVVIDDPVNNRKVKVPPSVAALGALAFNDKASYPWFAPAGFNRASLGFVTNVDVRLNSEDRDNLYDARINPIATFPREGFVVWGQKTLQQTQSALDRVNVRRLMVEIKRLVINIARKFVFEQNTPQTRAKFVTQVIPTLGLIQTQSGIEKFSVTMDETNNTQADIEANRLNGRIVVVPTRTIEFISIDFIVTNSGVSFT